MTQENESSSTGNDGRGAPVPTLTAGQLLQLEIHTRRRYPITDEDRKRSIEACREVMKNGKSQRAKLRAVSVLASLDSQSMRDDHHVEKLEADAGFLDLRMRRAEEGKPNDCVAVQVVPVRELPLPDALRNARQKLLEPTPN